MALGASERDVLAAVLARGTKLIFAGIALGWIGSAGLTRFMGSMLYGVEPADTVTYAGVSVLLSVVALVAAYIPARRALRVNPIVALRFE